MSWMKKLSQWNYNWGISHPAKQKLIDKNLERVKSQIDRSWFLKISRKSNTGKTSNFLKRENVSNPSYLKWKSKNLKFNQSTIKTFKKDSKNLMKKINNKKVNSNSKDTNNILKIFKDNINSNQIKENNILSLNHKKLKKSKIFLVILTRNSRLI